MLSSCATGELDLPPEVSLADLRPGQVGLFEQRVGVTLRIRNPNDAALPIDGYRFALELNGQPFASGFSDQRLTVPRLGESTTDATAVVSTLDLLRQVMAAPLRGGFDYRLTGTAFVDAATGRRGVPFEQTGKLDLSLER
ncbi:MAG: LEA type 2 family protein [Pseudomonadota bacterium]